MRIKRVISIFMLISVLLSFGAYADGSESGIVDPYKLYTYEQMLSDLAALHNKYPELISVSSIGKSVEGRDLPVFYLGKGDRDILICASMHAREYVSTNFVMYMTEQYCIGYESGAWYAGLSYQKILDSVRFVIVPMLNPDGVNLAQNGIEQAARKESLEKMQMVDTWKNGYYAWKANINGVDLNRNWPYIWAEDSKVKTPASANYNGSAPLTEPEVIAMHKLIEETPFYMFCSFHTSGEVIYWIDSTNGTEMAKNFSPIISRIANFIGYRMLGYENISSFGGYMINYARATYQKPCFTVELCPINVYYPFSDYAGFRNTVTRVLPIGLLMADEVMKMDKAEAEKPSPKPEPAPPPQPEPETSPVKVNVCIDSVPIIFEDTSAVIENNRTLVPLRAVCEALGLKVEWKAGGLITVSDGETSVRMQTGVQEMLINEQAVTLDVPPKVIGGRTLLPIRAVLEAFGHSLEWDGATKTVNVISKSANNDVVIPE